MNTWASCRCCRPLSWVYAGAFAKAAAVAATGSSPISFANAHEFKIYYSAFVDRAGKGFVAGKPGETVAEMLHELVHFEQPDHGLGDSASIQDAQMELSDLEAEGKIAIDEFYRFVLDPDGPLQSGRSVYLSCTVTGDVSGAGIYVVASG